MPAAVWPSCVLTSPREVGARCRAERRRLACARPSGPSRDERGEKRFEVRVASPPPALTPVDARLLRKLAAKPGRVFSRTQLMDALYEDHRVVSDRTVDSHVKNLRRKLVGMGVDPIASVYGVGYRFEWDESA